MKGWAAGLGLIATLLAAPTHARQPEPRRLVNPSAVIAAELAFARTAQEKGQWTAFAETAAPDAVMFTPTMVHAQAWLKGRANPPVAVKWQPHEVWSSCDGSLVVSHGAWQGPKATGYFTTIWQRQKNGDYKWIVDARDALSQPLPAPEMLSANVADCPARRSDDEDVRNQPPGEKPRSAPAPLDPAHRSGKSDDGTLSWKIAVRPDGARNLSVQWTKDGAAQTVLNEDVAAPPAAKELP